MFIRLAQINRHIDGLGPDTVTGEFVHGRGNIYGFDDRPNKFWDDKIRECLFKR